MKKLDVTKPCKLRSGEPVTYLTTLENPGERRMVFKFADSKGHESITSTYEGGFSYKDSWPSNWDVINDVREYKIPVLLVLTDGGTKFNRMIGVYDTQSEADAALDTFKKDYPNTVRVTGHVTWEV